MQQTDVELPAGELIDSWEFTLAIAKALYPSLRDSAGGACVTHKLVRVHRPIPFLPFELPIYLSEEEREKFDQLILDLPTLHSKMSDQEVASFMDAYHAHPKRPPWEPLICTAQHLKANREEIGVIQNSHLAILHDFVKANNISVFDRNHIPVATLGVGKFIIRADALEYLKQHGFSYVNLKRSTPQTKQNSAEESSPGRDGTKQHWTPERLAALAKRRSEIGTTKAAVENGISAARVRQLLPTEPKMKPRTDVFSQSFKR